MLIRRKSDNAFILKFDEKTKGFLTIASIKGALANGGNTPLPVAQRRVADLAAIGIETYIADALHGQLYDPKPEEQSMPVYTAVEAPPEVVPEPTPEPVAVVQEGPRKVFRPADCVTEA